MTTADQAAGTDATVTVVGEPGRAEARRAKRRRTRLTSARFRPVPSPPTTPSVPGKRSWPNIGFAIIHNKIVVIDPFSDNCTVVTGSHNLGFRASHNNDENMLIIRGHRGLAEAYACHVLDLYDHYAWRFLLKQHPEIFGKPLQGDDTWQERYISGPDLKSAELRFWLAAATGVASASPANPVSRKPASAPAQNKAVKTGKKNKVKKAAKKTTATNKPARKKTTKKAAKKQTAKKTSKKTSSRKKVTTKAAKKKAAKKPSKNKKSVKKSAVKKPAKKSVVGRTSFQVPHEYAPPASKRPAPLQVPLNYRGPAALQVPHDYKRLERSGGRKGGKPK